jgi:LysM repeat protein
VYVVQPRDTLNQIGAKLDADVKCIAEGNTLTNGLIYAGQTLIISADCPKYTGDQVIPPLSSVVQPASQATATAPTPETTPEGGSG